MFDRGGQVSGIAGISRDITALKNSEEMLREQSERNRMIIETAYDAFIGMDPDGSITAWNPQAELTFGWAADEVMGRRLCDIVIAPAYREAHAQGVEHFLAAQGRSVEPGHRAGGRASRRPRISRGSDRLAGSSGGSLQLQRVRARYQRAAARRGGPQERDDTGSIAAIGDGGRQPVLHHRTHRPDSVST